MTFRSTKTWGPISCAFRQPRALHSHCRHVHGYGLKFKATFECSYLDSHNWVMDFGGLKPIKKWLEETFDHKTILRRDDPAKDEFIALELADACAITWLDEVGCEAFAQRAGRYVQQWLDSDSDNYLRWTPEGNKPRVWLHSMEVMEHENNSAIWFRE